MFRRDRSLMWVVLLMGLYSGGWYSTGEVAAQTLRAGAAVVDVSPESFPVNMPGLFHLNMATTVHDPLSARALVLDDGETTVAIVLADNLGLGPEIVDEAKQLASEATGIAPEQMLICATHCHSAPEANKKGAPKLEAAYYGRMRDGLVASIVQAHKALREAAMGADSHPLPDEVFNRRWYLKPGKMPLNPFGELDQVKMNPGSNPDVLDRPAGPTDPDVTVLSVRDALGKPLALVANYSLHYVGHIPAGQVSADYFGEFARLMPYRLGAGENFVAMMTNGTSGDINNYPFLVTRPPREPFEQVRIVAQKAADAAWLAQRKIQQHQRDVPLGMVQCDLQLRYRRPTDQQLAAAKRVLAITDEAEIKKLPKLAQNYARNTVQAAQREQEYLPVRLQAIRVGELAICAIPFEVFAEIGLELKQRSPFAHTMVISAANGRHGYLPTPAQHALGGYETWLGTNRVQQDASVIITTQLLVMLDELHQAE